MKGDYIIKIELGTRKLQKGSSTFDFNAPVIAVRTFGLYVEGALEVSITDDSTLRIEEEHDPIVSSEFGDTTPTTSRHQILSGTERRCGINGDMQITAADAVIVLQMTVSGGQSDDTDMDGAGRAMSIDELMNIQTAAGYVGIG
jgi:hypothetical protein